MLVLHILNELKPSGAEAMLRAAAPFWRGRGIQGEILCTGETLGAYGEFLRDAGYRTHHLPFSRSVWFLFALYRFFRQHRYDCIHIHPERGSFWYATLAYFAGHRRMIRTVHNVFHVSGGLRVRRSAQRYIMRRIFNVRMIAISPSVVTCEREVFRNPTVLIPNWFDSNCYSPPTPEERLAARATLGVQPGIMAIASVAGCWDYKNHAAILRAIARIPQAFKIVYVHVGQEREDQDERRLAADLKITDRARFLGVVRDVSLILKASDVFLMPSTYEGFGVAAAEAMGAGLPVILSDVDGLRDMRALGAPVYWVEPTVDDIAKALLHFCQITDAKRRAIGRQLSEKAHQQFGIGTGAACYAALYVGTEAA